MPLSEVDKPGAKSWCLTATASFSRAVNLVEDGAAVDLTGYEAQAPIIDTKGDTIGAFAATITPPATDGVVTLSLTVAEVSALPLRSRWYLRLFVTGDEENTAVVLLKGSVIVNDPAGEDCCA